MSQQAIWAKGFLLAALCGAAVGCGNSAATSSTTTSTIGTGSGTLASGGAVTGYALALGTTNTSIVPFSLAASGTASNGTPLLLAQNFGPTAFAVDPTNGTVYVGGLLYTTSMTTGVTTTKPELLAYAAGASGLATPSRTIIGTATTADFDEPLSMTVDKSGNLYVASTPQNTGTVTVYSPSANGTGAPARVLTGGPTGLYQPTQIAVDGSGNIYVSNNYEGYAGNVVEFSSTQSGTVPPIRAITDDYHVFNGVAVDSLGTVYALEGKLNQMTGYVTGAQIEEYDPSASGAATPAAILSASALSTAGSLQIDGKNNLYVLQQTGTGTAVSQQVLVFGPNVSGTAAPSITINGSTTESAFLQFAIR